MMDKGGEDGINEDTIKVQAHNDLLRSGMEIIYIPGNALEVYLSELKEDESMISLFIYVIDGRNRVDKSDTEYIKQLLECVERENVFYVVTYCEPDETNIDFNEDEEEDEARAFEAFYREHQSELSDYEKVMEEQTYQQLITKGFIHGNTDNHNSNYYTLSLKNINEFIKSSEERQQLFERHMENFNKFKNSLVLFIKKRLHETSIKTGIEDTKIIQLSLTNCLDHFIKTSFQKSQEFEKNENALQCIREVDGEIEKLKSSVKEEKSRDEISEIIKKSLKREEDRIVEMTLNIPVNQPGDDTAIKEAVCKEIETIFLEDVMKTLDKKMVISIVDDYLKKFQDRMRKSDMGCKIHDELRNLLHSSFQFKLNLKQLKRNFLEKCLNKIKEILSRIFRKESSKCPEISDTTFVEMKEVISTEAKKEEKVKEEKVKEEKSKEEKAKEEKVKEEKVKEEKVKEEKSKEEKAKEDKRRELIAKEAIDMTCQYSNKIAQEMTDELAEHMEKGFADFRAAVNEAEEDIKKQKKLEEGKQEIIEQRAQSMFRLELDAWNIIDDLQLGEMIERKSISIRVERGVKVEEFHCVMGSEKYTAKQMKLTQQEVVKVKAVEIHFCRKLMKHQHIKELIGTVYQEHQGLIVLSIIEPRCEYNSLLRVLGEVESLKDRLELAVQVTDAICHIHSKNMIHRDIKPNNILVTMVNGQKMVKISGMECFTPISLMGLMERMPLNSVYTAPEVNDESTDWYRKVNIYAVNVYAMGILLWVIYKGQDFQENPDSNTRPQPHNDGSIRAECWNLMKECWDKSPAQRPDMTQVHRRLGAIIEQKLT